MRPLVYHSWPAGIPFLGLALAYLLREIVVQIRLPGRGRDPSYYAMLAGPFAGVALAFVLSPVGPRLPGPRAVPAALGIAAMAAGFAFRAWAVRELGRFFMVTVTVEDDHRVVDTGPYRLVRHPSYTGMELFFAGMAIALDSWLSLAAMLLPLAGIVIRIVYEERMLRHELGEPYRAYAARTKRLVPGVW